MNDRTAVALLSLSIAAVERDTGLSKDTLRVWERRYGFPQPARDAQGERAYPLDQVDRLRMIKRLMDVGHRPGRIVALPLSELQSLLASAASGPSGQPAAPSSADLQAYMDAIRGHDVEHLRRLLTQAQMRMGLARFVTELLAPLNVAIGEAWLSGAIEIFEEHIYTESVHVVLRQAITSVPAPRAEGRPRVLLTSVPNEPHGLGLLMVEALLALEGCRCLSLGTQTPVWDIVLAAKAHEADIVALSYTACQNTNQVLEGLEELRGKLAPQVELWAGGSCPVLHRRALTGVRCFDGLTQVGKEIARWRSAA